MVRGARIRTGPPAPRFLAEEDLAVFVTAFERTGFSGGLNYYRNMDRNWALTEPLADARVTSPRCSSPGRATRSRRFMPPPHGRHVTDLRDIGVDRGRRALDPAGSPEEVNAALLAFLRSL